MEFGNPEEFFSSIDNESKGMILERLGDLERLLKPEDRFRFTCDRRGDCCRNRSENPITVSPYGAYRLRKSLGVSGRKFVEEYGHVYLGADSRLPNMILRVKDSRREEGECTFLEDDDCSVYGDRPLVCRLYPAGRFLDRELKSYFFLTKSGNCCPVGRGDSQSIGEWIKSTGSEDHLDWNEAFHRLYMELDYQSYHSLPEPAHWAFVDILYDLSGLARKLVDRVGSYLADREEPQLSAIHYMARTFVEEVSIM